MKRWAQNAVMTAVTMNYAVGHEDKIRLKTECKSAKKKMTKWSKCDRGLLRWLGG